MRETWRSLSKQPAFSAAVVLVLALAMGVTSGLFTVMDGLWLRPLPFPHSERLVDIGLGGKADRTDLLQRVRSLESVGAFLAWNFPVAGADGVRMAYGFRVTADLVPLLQVQPALGRALTRADFGAPTVMIGHDYWRRLGAPPDIAGRSLRIDGQSWFIAGVLPADFYLGVRDVNLIVPNLTSGGRTLGRLHTGVTAAGARAEIAALKPGSPVEVTSLARAMRGSDGRPVVFLLATAALVLLIVCANLANLQLVRGLARRSEFAIRTALGAPYGRLMRQLALESAVLAAAGAALGLLLADGLHHAIAGILPVNISRRLAGADALAVDGRVVAFTAGLAVATTLLFGILPAVSALRFDLTASLRAASLGGSRKRRRFGHALVALETALSLMLLAGAGLAFRSITRIETQYLGFQPSGVLRAMTDFSPTQYARPERQVALFREVERRIGAIPGVSGVGIVAPQVFPFGGPSVTGARFEIAGRPEVVGRAEVYVANPAYLASIRLPLLRGRWFDPSDGPSSPPVAVLGETVARLYWGDRDCLGASVRLNADRADSPWSTVVGVVGDVRNPIADHWQPTTYRPFSQAPSGPGATLMIRASGGMSALPRAVQSQLHSIDATAPEFRIVAPLDAAVRDYSTPQRFTAALLALFAGVGLLLASAGVYAVMRYWVASRTGEIGIRLALGADRSGVMRLVLGRAVAAAGAGVAGGLAGALAIRKLMAAWLIGVSPADPLVLGAASAAMLAVALVAAWLPARRAARIDPSEALRSEPRA